MSQRAPYDPNNPGSDPQLVDTNDYNKDYWAPDRTQVLQSKGIQDTSGKTWNGSTWVDGSQGGQAPAAPAPPPTATAPAQNTWQSTGATQQAVPGGFDATKWNSADKHDPKYDIGHMVASGMSNDQIGQYLAQNYPGYSIAGKDTIRDDKGDIYDFRRDVEGANAPQWEGVGGPGFSGAQGLNGAGSTLSSLMGGGGFGGGFSGMSASSGFGGGPYNKLSEGLPYAGQGGDLWNLLMGHATQGTNFTSRDPIIANQVNAFRAEQERGTRNYIDQQAESGGPYSNLSSERRLANEHAAQATGGMQATLMQNELTARRQEIMSTLQQMGQFLPAEQRLLLERELNMITANLRQQEINSGNDQFMAKLGLDASQQANYWDWVRSTGSAP